MQQGNRMKTPLSLIALSAGVLWLSACDKTPATPPKPIVDAPAATEYGATAGSVADPSVPPAASVLTPANAASANPTAARTNSTMSAAQESAAMPMPGQNNDHSAPTAPARRASAP